MASTTEKIIKKSLVSEEQARVEVDSWLDFKQVDDSQREEMESTIKLLVSYIKNGNLILNEDKSFTHILKFPLTSTTELTYKGRITEREISQKLQAVKSDDGDGRLAAHVAALSGQVIGIAKALDKEDFKIARSVALFFV